MVVSRKRVHFKSGNLELEGLLSVVDSNGSLPAVIMCHPHPLFGGSMDNNVVDAVCDAASAAGMVTLKFNFRGVGGSEGEYGGGIGEQDDVRAAVSFILSLPEIDKNRVGLAGYSAGAGYAWRAVMKDARVKAFAGISLVVSMEDFNNMLGFKTPKLFISGTSDAYAAAADFERFCLALPEPKECRLIEGADHFWVGREAGLAAIVADFFSKALSRGN